MPELGMRTEFLARECKVFTNYLIGQDPTPYVLEKYGEAHRVSVRLLQSKTSPFDKLLLRLGPINMATMTLVDAYTSLMFRNSMARKKMVLLLAILESCAPTFVLFEDSDSNGVWLFAFKFIRDGLVFAVLASLGLLLLSPLHLSFELGEMIARAGYVLQKHLPHLRSELPAPSRVPVSPREMPQDLPPLQ